MTPGSSWMDKAARHVYEEYIKPIEVDRDAAIAETVRLKRELRVAWTVAATFAAELDAMDKAGSGDKSA